MNTLTPVPHLEFNNSIIEHYNVEENAGRLKLSNRMLQAFDLVTFANLGYPHRISDIQELWRFHDVMQETRFVKILNQRFSQGMPKHLFDLFKDLIFNINAFGHALPKPSNHILNAGQNSALQSMFHKLILDSLITSFDLKNCHILELGPGCGYHVLANALSGRKMTLIDSSQAFSIYQNTLFEFCAQANNSKYVLPERIHWFDAADSYKEFKGINLVVANHMLGEMHNFALRTIVAKLSLMWRESKEQAILVAESLGGGSIQANEQVIRTFQEFGFNAYHFEDIFVFVFTQGEPLDFTAKVEQMRQLMSNTTSDVISTNEVLQHVLYHYDVKTADETFCELIRITV